MKGKIIEFEGLDGSFKETNSKALYYYLLDKGIKVNIVSFPRHSIPEGVYIDKYLNGEYGNINRNIAKTLFALDRFDYIKINNVEDRVKKGEWFIFDRYIGSSVIYQTAKIQNLKKRRDEQMKIFEYEYLKLGLPSPDIVIAMNSNFNQIISILEKRDTTDKFESDKDYMQNVYNCFIQAIKDYDWKKIDVFKSEEEFKDKDDIFNDILELLQQENILKK